MRCYCISGLGANYKAFDYLEIDHEQIHLAWIPPLPNESLRNYAMRLAEPIDTSEPFLLLGLSFGGRLALEIAKVLNPQRLILISTFVSTKEFSWYIRLLGLLPIHRLIPISQRNPPMPIAYWIFGVNQTHTKKLLKDIISKSDPHFLKWALSKIFKSTPIEIPANGIRIHGNRDRLIPAKKIKNVHWIDKGGHLVIAQNAQQVNELIQQNLKKAGRMVEK